MENLTEKEVTELLALTEAATPGPWHWDIRPKGNSVTLTGGRSGWDTVMDSVRWGMGGASLRMTDPEVPGCLLPVHVDAVPFPGREHHKDWARTINPARTDAAYIAAANPTTLRRLLLELQQHRATAATPAAARCGSGGWVPAGNGPQPHEEDYTLHVLTEGGVANGHYFKGNEAEYFDDDPTPGWFYWGPENTYERYNPQPTMYCQLPTAPGCPGTCRPAAPATSDAPEAGQEGGEAV